MILAKLTEGVHPAAEIDRVVIAKKELEQILALEDAQDSPKSAVESDADSLPTSSQSSTRSTTITTPSPISGFIELYRYNAGTKTVYQDGVRCVLPPPSEYSPAHKLT